jgi:hypothetical protein
MKYGPVIIWSIIIMLQAVAIGVYFVDPLSWWRICKPDLLVENYTTEWPTEGGYVVHVTVKNDGCKKSPLCWICVNAICWYPPEGQEGQDPIRDQRYWTIEELQPSETAATHSFSFDAKVLMNERVDQIIIIVDATYYVQESNEENNFEYFDWPGV